MAKFKKTKRDNGEIVLPYGNGKRLADSLGISSVSVSYALKGVRIVSPENYALIRRRAIKEYGGRYLM